MLMLSSIRLKPSNAFIYSPTEALVLAEFIAIPETRVVQVLT